MNISFAEKKENLARIALSLSVDDYKSDVEKKLKELARKASVPGFRKGHVPFGMIKKMYGDAAKIETIEGLISEHLYNFIRDEKLETLGQPIPSKDQPQIDFAKAEDIELTFDQALAPEITDLLSKDNKFDFYHVITTDEMVDEMLEEARNGAGKYIEPDSVEENDIIRGTICELNGDLPKEGGIRVEESAMLLPKMMKNESEKAKFVGSSKNSVVVFSPYKAYDGNVAELTSLLKIEREQVEALKDSEFSFEINKITRHVKAKLDQEFFDQVFGEGVVKTLDEAKAKIREISEARTEPDSLFIFLRDVKKYIKENKLSEIDLDVPTIRRWFVTTDSAKKIAAESFDKEFADMIENLKLDLYMAALAKKYGVEVSDEEIKGYAMEMTRMQFQQYGMGNMPEETLANFAQRLTSDQNSRRQIYSQIEEQKMAKSLKDDVTLEVKDITTEEFQKISNPAALASEEKESEEK